MRRLLPLFFYTIALIVLPCAARQQDLNEVREVAHAFLSKSASNYGKVKSIDVSNIDVRLKLKKCEEMNAYLPIGSKAWGKLNVAVRCTTPNPWQVFIAATVDIEGDYLVAASQLKHGQSISENDFIKVHGSLASLPANIVMDLQAALGLSVQGTYSPGTILRSDMLKAPLAIQQGQAVKLVSSGPGFKVSTDAIALNNANDGQTAKAKTNNGQVIVGIAKLGNIIEIQN